MVSMTAAVGSFLDRSISAITSKSNNEARKLATGYSINNAADDAAGLSISQKLKSLIRGYETVEKNIGDGISMSQTAEGGLNSIVANLQDLRKLAVQAANGTNSNSEKGALQQQASSIISNINDIANQSTFNGKNLLDGSTGSVSIQSGTATGNTTPINLSGDFAADSLSSASGLNSGNSGGAAGVAINNIDLVNGNTNDILKGIDNAIANATAQQSDLGASQNALESKLEYASVAKEAAMSANSRIADADMAASSSRAVGYRITQQFAAALKAQSNAQAASVLNLIPKVTK